ncbi:MAG TPA: hypothetical protein VFH82_03890 [Gemmatimonadota bacterium]|jgi:hypothetical protein|nr:hypothetical protein [Gemmatimonadota bacterium]
MAMFPIVVVKEKRSSVGAEQVEGGTLSVQIAWYDRASKEIQHLELDTHLRDVIGDTALLQGVPARAVDGAYQIELGDEDIPSAEYDIIPKR